MAASRRGLLAGIAPKVFDNMLEKYRKLLPKFHDTTDMSFP